MYHIFFIHPFVKGHLDCFHILATVNGAAVNTGVHVSLQIKSFSLGICPGVGLQDHTVILFLVFERTSIFLSIMASPTYIPITSAGLLSLYTLLR